MTLSVTRLTGGSGGMTPICTASAGGRTAGVPAKVRAAAMMVIAASAPTIMDRMPKVTFISALSRPNRHIGFSFARHPPLCQRPIQVLLADGFEQDLHCAGAP